MNDKRREEIALVIEEDGSGFMNCERLMATVEDLNFACTMHIQEIDRLNKENERLRAELARIRPSWDDAPEWATERITFILSKRNIEDTIVHSEYIRRPKDDR